MEKHKDKALEKDCLCSKCIFRFQCFTQERIFSDPILQGLFEALMAGGLSKEEALEQVTNEIKFRINLPKSDPVTILDNPWSPNITYPITTAPYTVWTGDSINDGSDNILCDVKVSYTMNTGEIVSWSISNND